MENYKLENIQKVRGLFREFYHEKEDIIIVSCGRLEVLGNHTEYSSGLVINASTDNLSIYTAAKKTSDGVITIKSEGYQSFKVDINDVELNKDTDTETSLGLVKGVVKRLLDLGYKVGGFEAFVTSTIFKGAGVSSSSSFAVMIGKLLSYFYNEDKIDHIVLAFTSKWAENNYFGKNSGIQDALGCVSDGMELLDCKDQEHPIITHFKAPLDDYSILLINSLTNHANKDAGLAFQSIVDDYHYIASLYGEKYLRFIPKEDFLKKFNEDGNSTKRAYKRAYHYIHELERVNRAYDGLTHNNLKEFFDAFNESGLSNENMLCNVCLESEKSNSLKEVIDTGRKLIKDGAIRVHGGGFGGASITIINKKEKDAYIKEMEKLVGKDNIIEVVISHEPLKEVLPE